MSSFSSTSCCFANLVARLYLRLLLNFFLVFWSSWVCHFCPICCLSFEIAEANACLRNARLEHYTPILFLKSNFDSKFKSSSIERQ